MEVPAGLPGALKPDVARPTNIAPQGQELHPIPTVLPVPGPDPGTMHLLCVSRMESSGLLPANLKGRPEVD